MIRDGFPSNEVEEYLIACAWLTDAARVLGQTPESIAAELAKTMVASGGAVVRDRRLRAAAPHSPVDVTALIAPFPSAW